jgi:hypothetical protein
VTKVSWRRDGRRPRAGGAAARHPELSIHCTTPVALYLRAEYASNMARWLSYASSWLFLM